MTILNALAGKPISVYGKGENVRDWIHVDDHVRALVEIVNNGRIGETYNVGANSERRNIEVVREICRILDDLSPDSAPHDRLITFVTDRPGHDARYAIDGRKLQSELGWHPRETFASGIEQTVRWYLDNRWWWEPLEQRYAGGRLGLLDTAPDKTPS